MRRFLKWTGIVVAGVILLVAAAGVVLYLLSNARINAAYTFMPGPVAAEADSISVARGEHIAIVRGCADCHGMDLGGGAVIEAPPVAMLYATNLTAGDGGRAADYRTEADWVRAIRHGIGPDGKALIFMPAQEYQVLSDEDIGDLIAYIRTRPPVDRVMPETTVGPVGRLLHLAGQFELIPAELVDHENLRPPARMKVAPTAEYGAYLATGCFGCHGKGLSGGKIPGTPPEIPEAANITPDVETGTGSWTFDDFDLAMREGVRPDGTTLDPFMPIQLTSRMTDVEMQALWAHIQTLPPTPYGNR